MAKVTSPTSMIQAIGSWIKNKFLTYEATMNILNSATKIYIYKDGKFINSPAGTSVDNQVGPFRWTNSSQRKGLISPYFFTNKIILDGYNCDTNFAAAIEDGYLTQNKSSGYGPNNCVNIPIKRIRNTFSKAYIVVKKTSNTTTRVYPTVVYVDDNLDRHGIGNGRIIPGDDFDTYDWDISDTTTLPYIDYFEFLTESGKPIIKEVWLE